MLRTRRHATIFTVLLALSVSTAWAQFGNPVGYGAYGWGGWGGGASTVQGDVARGLGAYAAGAGQYNQQTAVARSINADTAMRWNEYLWQSQQAANRRQAARMAKRGNDNNEARSKIAQRLRDNPDAGDINRGDALNVALDEINNPRVYLRNLKSASAKIPGAMIRDIPFRYAAEAVTTSVEQITKGGPPAVLKTPAFATDAAELKAISAEVRAKHEETGEIDPALLEKARVVVRRLRTTVESTLPRNTPDRRTAENFLKAVYALTQMLETPAINVLLAGVENRPETTVGELLTFMNSFNFRFGVANTPRQRAVYNDIYPKLVKIRDEAGAAVDSRSGPTTGGEGQPIDVFSGMALDQMNESRPATPAPPAPAPR